MIFQDDFESYQVGVLPTGYTFPQLYQQSSVVDYGLFPGKYLEVITDLSVDLAQEALTDRFCQQIHTNKKISEGTVKLTVKPEGLNFRHDITLFDITNERAVIAGILKIHDELGIGEDVEMFVLAYTDNLGEVNYRNANQLYFFDNIAIYRIELDINKSSATARLYEDGVLVQTLSIDLASEITDADVFLTAYSRAVTISGDSYSTAQYIGNIEIDMKGSENMENINATGSPLDAYEIVVAIADSGGLNAGTFRYSLDGGDNFSKKITIPTLAVYEIPNTGITLEFADVEYTAGDTFKFRTTAPQASIESIMAAVDVLLNSKLTYELIHIVGESDSVMWAALTAKAAEAENKFRWIHFVCEAQGLSEDVYSGMMDADGWANALVEEAANFANNRVTVVAARAEIADITGRVSERNAAGIYVGRLVSGKVSQSPGKVMLGSLPGVVKLTPEGINDAHITMLDDAGFVTFREYEGYDGVYVTNGRMMSEEGSDYTFVENRRVMDKACRSVRMEALRFMQAEATEGGLNDLEARLTTPINLMASNNEIASGRVIIPRDQNLLSGETLKVKIRLQPIAIMRNIEIEIGFENPYN